MTGDATETRAMVRTIVAEQVGKDPAGIDDGTRLADLGVGSLDTVEIIFALEERLGIDIPYNANTAGVFALDTIGDVVRAIQAARDAG